MIRALASCVAESVSRRFRSIGYPTGRSVVRSKKHEGSIPVVEELERKQTITDAIVPIATGMQAAGLMGTRSIAGALETNLADIAIADGARLATRTGSDGRHDWQAVLPSGSWTTRDEASAFGGVGGDYRRSWFGTDDSSTRTETTGIANDVFATSVVLTGDDPFGARLDDSLEARSHGQNRGFEFELSAAAAGGASTTFVANAGTSAFASDRADDIPGSDPKAARTGPIPARPAPPVLPPIVLSARAARNETDATVTASGFVSPQTNANANDSAQGGATGASPDAAAGNGYESSAITTASASGIQYAGGPPSRGCGPKHFGGFAPQSADGATSRFSGAGPQPGTLNPQPATPHGPPIEPPGKCQSAIADPLFVLDWNDGLVLFPGVTEYEFNQTWVDLRAQVYGGIVQSYQWNLSQAPGANFVSGANTYRLQFMWMGQMGSTQRITVTANMVGGAPQVQTLTFVLGANSSPGGPGGPPGGSGTIWPTVLQPDWVSEPQALLAGDSHTRPYGVSLASGGLFVSHELPPYNPGVPPERLVYNSIAAAPKPIFVEHYQIDPAGGIPDTVSARLQFNGAWGPSKYYLTGAPANFNPGAYLQISLQADASTLPTGRFDYTVEVTAHYTGGDVTSATTGKVNVVNHKDSRFGSGWTLELVGARTPIPGGGIDPYGVFDRLHPLTDGIIVDQGAGNTLWFATLGGGYATPRGEFSSLVHNADGTFTRTFKDGVKQNFNDDGLLTSIVDRNGNSTDAFYDNEVPANADKLLAVRDANGQATTFSYVGADCPTGKVCSITDPAGRTTTLKYTGDQLTSLTLPDGAVW